jgi:hypothetical protein
MVVNAIVPLVDTKEPVVDACRLVSLNRERISRGEQRLKPFS